MENRNKIRNMSDEELAKFLQKVSKNYMMQYYDMQKWLRQETFRPIYAGTDGWYLKGRQEAALADIQDTGIDSNIKKRHSSKNLKLPCRIVEKKKEFGEDYRRIIVDNDLMDVPAKYVREKRKQNKSRP